MMVGVNAWADTTGTIKFGTNDVKINGASVTGDDDLGNTWTITTVGTTSFTPQPSYSQVGSKNSPATSITLTTTLSESVNVKSMSAKFGGFSGTTGSVELKVGETTVGKGSLDAANDVTVNSTSSASGTVLSVTVTDIDKGVKVYSISYTIEGDDSSGEDPTPATYTVTIANDIANGAVTADPTSAAEGDEVTLTATPAEGYEFGSWNVTNASTSEAIAVTDNKFTMPAADVNVSATFNMVQGGETPERPANEFFYESFDTNDGTGGNDDSWSGNIASNNVKYDNAGWSFTNTSGANKCVKIGVGSKLGTATTPALGKACDATLAFKAAAWNGNTESTTLKLSVVGGGTVSPATVTLKKGEWTNYTVSLTNLTADSKVKFEGNAASNSRFFLDEVSVMSNDSKEKTLTLVATDEEGAYYATFSSDKVTFWPEDYIVSAVGVENGEIYTFDNDEAFDEEIVEIDGESVIGYYVPANTGILITSLESIVKYYTAEGVTPSTDVEAVNMLQPASKEKTGNFKFYKLAYGDAAFTPSTLGFYYGAADGAAFTSREGSAYLAVPAEAASAKGFTFSGKDATAIKNVENKVQTNAVYNLAGQRVSSKSYKGIVIKNGKQILNK